MLALVQTILAVLLVAAIVVTQKGADTSMVFGGTSEVYTQKRGAEKFLFRVTVLLALGFASVSLALMFV